MQPLQETSRETSAACAREILDSVPKVMQYIRLVAQRGRDKGLPIQQFRTLGFLRHRPSSLSDVAEYLGLSLPTVSRMVDGLVRRGLLSREQLAEDRRQVRLKLLPEGEAMLRGALDQARRGLECRLSTLSETKRTRIRATMRDLQELFDAPPAKRDQ